MDLSDIHLARSVSPRDQEPTDHTEDFDPSTPSWWEAVVEFEAARPPW